MIETIEISVGLLAVVAALQLLAKRVAVPLPILLVIAGLLLALLPGLPRIQLNPQLVLLIFLPPLVYEAAANTSWADFRRHLRPITLLAFGLMLVTIVMVAIVAHLVFPGMGWGPAFVLGAVVAPPDVAAAIAIMRRLRVPRRIALVLEGEGLTNDVTALIMYRFGVAAVLTQTFSLPKAVLSFAAVVAGELLWGLAVGWMARHVRARAKDPMVEVVISLMTPFAAYIPAEELGGSGVLATVVAGLSLSSYISTDAPSVTRMQGRPFWETTVFLLNGLLFLLTGLQLRMILDRMQDLSLTVLLTYGCLITAVVIVVRFLWVFPVTYLPRVLSRSLRKRESAPPWQHSFFISWTGMRGGISLAAAVGIPLTLPNDAPFPQRELIIFLTFFVIFMTLAVQGLTLPLVIRRLGLIHDGTTERGTFLRQEHHARVRAAEATMAKLDDLGTKNRTSAQAVELARHWYQDRIHQLQRHDQRDGPPTQALSSQEGKLLLDAIASEREHLIHLSDQGMISDQVLRHIGSDLDLEEMKIRNDILHADEM
jgi:monovalent cation/hydrogen antiporter